MQFIKVLQEDKAFFESKIENFPEEDKIPYKDIGTYKQSELTKKAMSLLNVKKFFKYIFYINFSSYKIYLNNVYCKLR